MFSRATRTALMAGLLALAGAAQAAPAPTYVDFSSGDGGWRGINPWEPIEGQGTWIDPTLGNTAPGLHSLIPDSFMVYWTNTSAAVTGDYTLLPSVTIGLDANALSIINLFTGAEVSRQLVVELRDLDNTTGGLPWTSVWFDLGTIAAGQGWQRLSVTIEDTRSLTLPAGWGGYGAENDFGEPVLPAGTSFADVLRGVDEVVFTTAVPGWFYGFTYFDVALDNIEITPVPEPGTLALHALGLALVAGAARRRLGRAIRPSAHPAP